MSFGEMSGALLNKLIDLNLGTVYDDIYVRLVSQSSLHSAPLKRKIKQNINSY